MHRVVLAGHEEGEAPRGLLVVSSHVHHDIARSLAFHKLRVSKEYSSKERELPVILQVERSDGWHDLETLVCRHPCRLALDVFAFRTGRVQETLLAGRTWIKEVRQRFDSVGQRQTQFEVTLDQGQTWHRYYAYGLVSVGERVIVR